MFNMKNIPLFFLEVSLVILPAFVYGIPILPTVPQEKPFLKVPHVDDLNLLPEELDAVVPAVPISTIIPIEPVDHITSIPQIDKVPVPLTEKLLQKEVVPAELNPQVQQLPLVDNSNFLPEKPKEVVPLAVVASILHIDNVQVIIPEKLLEKIFVGLPEKLEGTKEELLLVTVDSLPQVGEVEKLGEPLSPLAVIALIPHIGNIQLVFSGELIKNILSKKLIPSVPVELKPEVVDDAVLTLKKIVPEKPLLLVPEVLDAKVDNVLLEKLVVPKELPVTVLPGVLEEIVTEKPLLLVPGEPTLQTDKEELLDKLPSKELFSLDPVKSKLNVLPGVLEQKPIDLASGVVNEISNLLPAVPTFKPPLELSTHEKLPTGSNE